MKSNVGNRILSISLLPLAFTISRFRFWIYTGGTFVLGVALGMENWQIFFSPLYYLYLFYFFFPANLFILYFCSLHIFILPRRSVSSSFRC